MAAILDTRLHMRQTQYIRDDLYFYSRMEIAPHASRTKTCALCRSEFIRDRPASVANELAPIEIASLRDGAS
jgi:hypothetical protein